jgi:hydroxyacylglutathione hydrolase
MIVERFYETQLAQASYLIGCAASGTAVVIDANRNVDQYLRAAAAEGLAITHVTETHIHADFVSGSRELAVRTGATLLLSDEGGPEWRYAFAAAARAVLLKDQDSFRIGNVHVDVVHTPGHTPEHLMFVITDTAVTSEPLAAVTGDFVFVGDVGRPDLLERAAGVRGSMEEAARTLFSSLARLQRYPDHLQIWPGHGAGSACGKSLGALAQSTLGYERRVNWAFQISDEAEFVRQVLEGQPDPPKYFAEMKRVNKEGPALRGDVTPPRELTAAALAQRLGAGAVVIDTRPADEFAAAHLPGTLNIPLNSTFTTWAGWLVPYSGDLILVANADVATVNAAVHHLALIGLDRVLGYVSPGVLAAWTRLGRPLASIPQVDAAGVEWALRSGGALLLDVRTDAEWDAGHIAGARHVPLGRLAEHLRLLAPDQPIVVQCQSGGRSAIAASLLRSRGFGDVTNFTGGLDEWLASGHAIEPGQRRITSAA